MSLASALGKEPHQQILIMLVMHGEQVKIYIDFPHVSITLQEITPGAIICRNQNSGWSFDCQIPEKDINTGKKKPYIKMTNFITYKIYNLFNKIKKNNSIYGFYTFRYC